MSVQIKAYLYEGGRPCRSKEIRRFSVDQDVLSSYEYLRKKVSCELLKFQSFAITLGSDCIIFFRPIAYRPE